jgi:hypothetical protein
MTIRLLRIGSAKRLTLASDSGNQMEAIDSSDRWFIG